MAREIAGLASGTIARLCGSPSYEDVDSYTAGWMEWVRAQPCNKRWRSWMECHDQYVSHLTIVTLAAGFQL